MKRAALFLALMSLVITSCGLKVPLTIVAGEQLPGEGDATVPGELGDDLLDGIDGPGATDDLATGDVPDNTNIDGSDDDVTGPVTGLFDNETEGITRDRIRICGHVPISGAAPIPHHPDRFGQFYFNYVNQELGGVFGRKVEFIAENDNYNPAGARDAVEKCKRRGAFFYVGAAGTDQIVSVARWAERNRLPYLHGPTSDKDLKGLKYNVHVGPTYEYQHVLLARMLWNEHGDVPYGVIRVNSPYFDAGSQTFKNEIERLGGRVPVDIPVQKDESQFLPVYTQLRRAGVEVINNFTTPTIWITMLNQKPADYNPLWTAVSPVAGFNIVAAALANARANAIVFHHFNPACNCIDYSDRHIGPARNLPWWSDIQEFLRIFRQYSPEQKPDPDDFDYASYLGAKSLYRLLLQLGENPTRSGLWTLLQTYKEDRKDTFPGCPADFTRNDQRMGAWFVNVFRLQSGTWSQVESCVESLE